MAAVCFVAWCLVMDPLIDRILVFLIALCTEYYTEWAVFTSDLIQSACRATTVGLWRALVGPDMAFAGRPIGNSMAERIT